MNLNGQARRPAKMVEIECGRCIWKTYGTHRLAVSRRTMFLFLRAYSVRLCQLYAEDNLDAPIAHFQPASSGTPATLVMQAGTERIRDDIVAGLVYLEQKQRITEKIIRNADGLAQIDRASAMGNTIG